MEPWRRPQAVLRDVLSRRTRKLGEKHPDTIDTAKTLGAADPLTEEVAHNLEIVLRNQ